MHDVYRHGAVPDYELDPVIGPPEPVCLDQSPQTEPVAGFLAGPLVDRLRGCQVVDDIVREAPPHQEADHDRQERPGRDQNVAAVHISGGNRRRARRRR